jgi:hypothetical protein
MPTSLAVTYPFIFIPAPGAYTLTGVGLYTFAPGGGWVRSLNGSMSVVAIKFPPASDGDTVTLSSPYPIIAATMLGADADPTLPSLSANVARTWQYEGGAWSPV